MIPKHEMSAKRPGAIVLLALGWRTFRETIRWTQAAAPEGGLTGISRHPCGHERAPFLKVLAVQLQRPEPPIHDPVPSVPPPIPSIDEPPPVRIPPDEEPPILPPDDDPGPVKDPPQRKH